MGKKTLLFAPGFVSDTFCTIENRTIELTKELSENYNVIWLVQDIKSDCNYFKNPENRDKLTEPVYVSEIKKHGIQHITVSLSKKNQLKNYFILKKVFKENQIDAVMVEFGIERFIMTFWAKMFGKQLIWYEHYYSLNPDDSKFVALKKVFYRFFISNYIAVSNHIAETLPKNGKIFAVQNAAELKDTSIYNKAELKKTLGLDGFEKIIIMTAAFRSVKRYDLAVKIVKHFISNSDKNVGFIFLGDGELFEQYKQIIREENLDKHIILPGHTSDVGQYLALADVAMLTSIYGEGLPSSLLESMNHRLPMVTFDMEWAREIIEDDKNGYLVEPENYEMFSDRLLELVNNAETRTKFGEESYNKLKDNFSLPVWRKKMREVFKEII